MPRFTSIPSRSSLLMRRAMSVCGSMLSPRNEVIDERSRRDNMVGGYHTGWHYMLGIYHSRVRAHCHHGIEITPRQRIRQIAIIVAKKRLHERVISVQSWLD